MGRCRARPGASPESVVRVTASERIVIDRGVAVPMADGVVLRADVYRRETGRWPTLVTRTPYGRGIPAGTFVSVNPVVAVIAGFAVVVQDVRGRGDSDGEYSPFFEGDDGAATVAWAAAQSWSNGRVGSFGSSYMAAAQIQMAATAPDALEVICPAQASDDYYEGRSYWGGAFELGALLSITLGTVVYDAMRRVPFDVAKEHRAAIRASFMTLAAGPPTFPLWDNFAPALSVVRELAPWFLDWVAHAHKDEYWTDRNPANHYESMRVPALHITGWYDAFCAGAVRNFTGMQARAAVGVRDQQHLIIGPWTHYALPGHSMAGVGERYFGADAVLNLEALQLRWLAEHLTEAEPAARTPVRYFLMGANQWRDAATWPPPDTAVEHWYLATSVTRTDGRLQRGPPAQAAVTRFDYDPRNPVPTSGGAHLVLSALSPPGPLDQRPIEQRDDVVCFTSEPLDRDLTVAGWVAVVLFVESTAPSTDFTAALSEVEGEGRSVLVGDGIRRVETITPGPQEISISLGPTAQVFRAGHRIRLRISSSNYPRFDPNPNTGNRSFDERDPQVARQGIVTGPGTPSRLELHVQAASTGAPSR